MDEVEVQVVEAKLLECVVVSRLDLLRFVRRVPQLRRDEKVLPLDDRGNDRLEGLADLVVISVDLGKVKVLVSALDSVLDG